MKLGLFACLALLLPALAHAQDDRKPLQLDVAGELAIDTDGTVYQHNITTIVTPEIKALLDKAIDAWRFEPVVRMGQAVPARSSVYLTLTATPVEAGYRLRIERVRFGGSRKMVTGSLRAIYPHEAVRARASAEVQLAVRVDGAGKVLDAVALRSRLLGVRAKANVEKQLLDAFERDSVRAIRDAMFNPADLAHGEPADTTLIMPMMFCVEGACETLGRPGWRLVARDLGRAIPWLPAERQAFDADGLGNGQTLARDGAHKLKQDLAGTSL